MARSGCAKSSASGDTCIRSVVSHQQWNLIRFWIDAPLRKMLFDVVEERPKHGGNASADDNDVRIEEINNVTEPRSQEICSFCQNFTSDGIPCGIGLRHLFAGNCREISFGKVEDRGVL